MQNTFSQSGNDSKWFSKISFFRIDMWNLRPPTFMEKNILNFHFDYLNTSLMPTPHDGMFGEESYPQLIFFFMFSFQRIAPIQAALFEQKYLTEICAPTNIVLS